MLLSNIEFSTTPSNNWKGKTLYQVIATIQQNNKNGFVGHPRTFLKSQPLKIYRKEICKVVGNDVPCSTRVGVSIRDVMESAGTSIISSVKVANSTGLVNALDLEDPQLKAEQGKCTGSLCVWSPDQNARRRVRSSGMITKKYDVNYNNDTYSTSYNQYLVSRNRTIKQNEYQYIRQGTTGIVPGSPLSKSNVYSPAGLSHCYQPIISPENQNNTFRYRWVDGTLYNVTIPTGLYDVAKLNTTFQNIQLQNKTYMDAPNGNKHFLLMFSFDTTAQSVLLIANVTSQDNMDTNSYTVPAGATWTYAGLPVYDPSPSVGPPVDGATYFDISANEFSNLIGFAPGVYFGGVNGSNFRGCIVPNYVPLYYKPSNPQFATQGSVDASARLARLKYNTINTGASSIRSAFGSAAANALAYGVSEQAYTSKSVAGDKVIYTPVVTSTGQLCQKRYTYKR